MRRGLLVLICAVILLLTSLIFPLSNLKIPAESQLDKFKDNTEEKIILIPDYGTSFELELPADTVVLNATMKISVAEYNNQYAYNPRLILGNTTSSSWWKTLWAYDSKGYGAMGYQQFFKTGTDQNEIYYQETGYNDGLRMYLPAGAEVSSAKVNLSAFTYDHWSEEIKELNPEPDGTGDYEPELLVFKNSLFAVFRSYNPEITNGSDSDIVVNSTSDGVNWTGMRELRPVPDSSPPYNDPYESADWRPTLETFKNRLYCAWESNSTTTTTGLDRDIILRSSSDGNTWSTGVINVTDSWEDDYSKNPGLKNDWDADLVVFNNSLWLVWVTNNTDPIGGFDDPANDIMISNSSDGVSWRNATDLTDGDNWFVNDISPYLAVFNNSLYVVWSSNNTNLNKGLNDQEDYDIIYRNTSDGVSWSEPQVLNPNDNDPLTKKGTDDLQPTLIATGSKLYCAWVSNSYRYTEGVDYDIVIGYTSDGNFTEVENYLEVTDENNDYTDHSPKLATFNNRIYTIWVSDIEGNSEILLRYLSPTNDVFGFKQQVNPADAGGDDYWPQILEFNNRLYSVWVSSDQTTGTGYDRDIILRQLQPSNLPIDIELDVGGDGSVDISPGTQLASVSKRFDVTTGFQDLLSNTTWVQENSTIKSYGNRIVDIPLTIHFSGPGKIVANKLEIYYNCTFQTRDFGNDLNYFITQNRNDITNNGKLVIPFTIPSDTPGKLKVSEVEVVYNHPPEVGIIDIPATGKTVSKPTCRIRWSAFDLDDDAMISLYYDEDEIGFDGELIISNLSEDSTKDYYDWVWWRTMPEGGTVHIYAEISDGNSVHQNYSAGPLIIQKININNFIDISLVQPDGVDDEAWAAYDITWDSHCPGEDAKIMLFYDNDTTGFDGFAIDINENGFFDAGDFVTEGTDDGLGTYTWDITNLQPGNKYYIYTKITNQWNISIYNYSLGPLTRTHMPAPRDFKLVDDLDPADDNFTTHNQNPRLSWSRPETEITDNLEYLLQVWLGADKTGEMVYNITTVATTTTILNGLEYGQTYYAEVYAYTSNNHSSIKTGLTFQVINHAPSAPSITITPKMPDTTSTLLCSIVNESYDVDSDMINYTYSWFKDGSEQVNYKNLKNIPADATAKGERWQCVVLPFDNIEYGPNATAEVIIRNSPPTIDIIKPAADKEYKDDEAIFFNFSATDADPGDREYLTYTVYAGLKELRSGYVPSTRNRVEFYHELPAGTYNLRFNVSDGETSTEKTLEIVIKKHEAGDQGSVVLLGFYAVIIIVIILVLIFLALLFQIRGMRKGVEEVEEAEELAEELEEEQLEEEELTEEEPELAEDELEEEELEEEELEE
ncbi:sialidase family protein [[Eubacterium] cellulosolvens]